MDVGPISSIRPVTMIKPSSSAPDLSRVIEVEYLGQSGDDEYTPADRKASRGLEDEEEETGLEPATDSEAQRTPAASVSLFA